MILYNHKLTYFHNKEVNIMKKTLSLVLILSMLICSSFSVFAAETTTGESPSVLTTTSESATP